VAVFQLRTSKLLSAWQLITSREAFSVSALERLLPRYVFVPRWSWRVPAVDIVASSAALEELFLRAGFAHVHENQYQSLPL
jgi:hypothetical protein